MGGPLGRDTRASAGTRRPPRRRAPIGTAAAPAADSSWCSGDAGNHWRASPSSSATQTADSPHQRRRRHRQPAQHPGRRPARGAHRRHERRRSTGPHSSTSDLDGHLHVTVEHRRDALRRDVGGAGRDNGNGAVRRRGRERCPVNRRRIAGWFLPEAPAAPVRLRRPGPDGRLGAASSTTRLRSTSATLNGVVAAVQPASTTELRPHGSRHVHPVPRAARRRRSLDDQLVGPSPARSPTSTSRPSSSTRLVS